MTATTTISTPPSTRTSVSDSITPQKWQIRRAAVIATTTARQRIQRSLAGLKNEAFNKDAADVDKDGEVTILDATAIQRKLAGLKVDSYDELAADTDGDGDVTVVDATMIQRYLAGLSCPKEIGFSII